MEIDLSFKLFLPNRHFCCFVVIKGYNTVNFHEQACIIRERNHPSHTSGIMLGWQDRSNEQVHDTERVGTSHDLRGIGSLLES